MFNTRFFRTSLFGAAFSLLAVLRAAGDMKIMETVETSNGVKRQCVMTMKGDKARLVMQGIPTWVYLDLVTGDAVAVNDTSKTYTKVPVEATKQHIDDLKQSKGIAGATPQPLTDTGRKERIGDFDTEVYTRDTLTGGKVTIWVCKAAPNVKSLHEQVEKLRSFISKIVPGYLQAIPDGIAMKTVSEESGETMTVTVTSMSYAPVRDIEILIPSDYKEETVTAGDMTRGDADHLYNAALDKIKAKDYEGAIDDLTKAVAIDPKMDVAYNTRGLMKKRQGDMEGAMADYNRALELNPKNMDALINRGDLKLIARDSDGSEADYRACLQLAPNSYDALTGLGRLLNHTHQYDEALAVFDKAVEIDPKRLEAYNGRGVVKTAKHDLKGALEDYNKAIAIDPKDPSAYFFRGNLEASDKNYDAAIEDFNRLLELAPKNVMALVGRGKVKTAKSDWDGAIADYKQAQALAPGDARIEELIARAQAGKASATINKEVPQPPAQSPQQK